MRLLACVLCLCAVSVQAASDEYMKTLPARLNACDALIALAAADAAVRDGEVMRDPFMMFSVAHALYVNGKQDEGVFWFYAGQLRLRYLAALMGGDYSQLLAVMMSTYGPAINNHALQDTARLAKTIERVLAWDKTTPPLLPEVVRTAEAKARIAEMYAALESLKSQLLAEKDAVEEAAKKAAPEIQPSWLESHQKQCQRTAQTVPNHAQPAPQALPPGS